MEERKPESTQSTQGEERTRCELHAPIPQKRPEDVINYEKIAKLCKKLGTDLDRCGEEDHPIRVKFSRVPSQK